MNESWLGWNIGNSYTQLPSVFYHKQVAAPVKKARLFIYNQKLAKQLQVDEQFEQNELAAQFLTGQLHEYYPESMALAYAGHQFGYLNRLGDGRALLLGEQVGYDIHLKGSGRTPYSRGGDGKAALGPMLREYIMSEAMYELGIPTTRSLSVVATEEAIIREQYLPGAVLCRVAASHLRVGTFEYAAKWGEEGDIKALADYAIERHFPQLVEHEQPYLAMLREVINRQAKLIASWQHIGFIHGVMNTDNMTISGETIDYGPCAFMNRFDPATVYSSIDSEGRYAYENQPYIGSWNLTRLAESLLPLLADDEEVAIEHAKEALATYNALYYDYCLDGMRAKLGLSEKEEEDSALISSLLQFMYDEKLDYTNTFVDLTLQNFIRIPSYQSETFQAWKLKWDARLQREQCNSETIQLKMMQVNPIVIARNAWVEEALKQAQKENNAEPVLQLLDLLKNPFDYSTAQRLKYIEPLHEPSNYQTYCGT